MKKKNNMLYERIIGVYFRLGRGLGKVFLSKCYLSWSWRINESLGRKIEGIMWRFEDRRDYEEFEVSDGKGKEKFGWRSLG